MSEYEQTDTCLNRRLPMAIGGLKNERGELRLGVQDIKRAGKFGCECHLELVRLQNEW